MKTNRKHRRTAESASNYDAPMVLVLLAVVALVVGAIVVENVAPTNCQSDSCYYAVR